MKEDFNLEQQSRRSPYRVPDGYFSELNFKLNDIPTQSTYEHSWGGGAWCTFLRMGGFALGFGVFVVLASVGMRFITANVGDVDGVSGISSTSSTIITSQASSSDIVTLESAVYVDDVALISMYDITQDDILSVLESDF